MAQRKYKVLDYSHAPEARPFAGREVTVKFFAEKDEVHVLVSHAHAVALRDALSEALARIAQIEASVGVGPVRTEEIDPLPFSAEEILDQIKAGG